MLSLAFFYTKDEVGLRMAYWFSFAAVAGAFGGLVAFGIQQVHAPIANWRLLFIIEVRILSCSILLIFQVFIVPARESRQYCWVWRASFSFLTVPNQQHILPKMSEN
jgi:MFS family permease